MLCLLFLCGINCLACLLLFGMKPLNKICSFVGTPLYIDLLTAKKQCLSFARVLVKVNLDDSLPNKVPISLPGGKILILPVLYEDIPAFCTLCKKIGHFADQCASYSSLGPLLYVSRARKQKTFALPVSDLSAHNLSHVVAAVLAVVQASDSAILTLNPTVACNTDLPHSVAPDLTSAAGLCSAMVFVQDQVSVTACGAMVAHVAAVDSIGASASCLASSIDVVVVSSPAVVLSGADLLATNVLRCEPAVANTVAVSAACFDDTPPVDITLTNAAVVLCSPAVPCVGNVKGTTVLCVTIKQ